MRDRPIDWIPQADDNARFGLKLPDTLRRLLVNEIGRTEIARDLILPAITKVPPVFLLPSSPSVPDNRYQTPLVGKSNEAPSPLE